MEGTWGGWPTGNSLEAGVAGRQTPRVSVISSVARRGNTAQSVEACKDHTVEKARQGRLHSRQSLETDLTSGDAGQDTGIDDRGEDLVRSRNLWSSPHQPFWGSKTAISRTSPPTASRTDTHRLAREEDPQLDQL